MKQRRLVLLLISVVLITTLACTIPGITEQVSEVQQTAQSIVTQAQGFATQAAPLIQTAQTIATNSPDLLETAQAFATQNAPIVSTLQAAATENPDLFSTLQAAITQNLGVGNAPMDIPVLEANQISNLITNESLVTYSTSVSYQEVLAFYQTQMINYGWEAVPASSYQLENVAVLMYQKIDRQATVSIAFTSLNNSTTIIISIQER